MKSLAVIAVSRAVLRAELFQMHQDRDESFRSYAEEYEERQRLVVIQQDAHVISP